MSCDAELSRNEYSHNNGVCPRCGYKAPGAVTIALTNTKVYRVTRLHPWWRFWKPVWEIDYKETS